MSFVKPGACGPVESGVAILTWLSRREPFSPTLQMGAAATMLSAEPIAMKAASFVETMVEFLYECVTVVCDPVVRVCECMCVLAYVMKS